MTSGDDETTATPVRRGGRSKPGGASRPGFDDPLPALPETARNLLLAAKRIIASQGFHALTLNSVSAASGENKAMIAYYFGNKAGLVAAVLDSVIHDEYIASLNRMKHVDPTRRRHQLVEEIGRMAGSTDEFRVFFEMLPHILRDDVLRARVAQLYGWYWTVKLQWLGAADDEFDDPDLLGLTQLLSAVIDGLAVQAAIDPEIDLANPLHVLATMLQHSPALPERALTSPTGEQGPPAARERP